MNQNIYVAGLHLLPYMNHKRLRHLCMKEPKYIWENLNEKELIQVGYKAAAAHEAVVGKDAISLEYIRNIVDALDIKILIEGYSEDFRGVNCKSDTPYILYCRGNTELLRMRKFAVVGARNMTPYGKQGIRKLVPPLLTYGLCIVSGLAYGVDLEAARVVLEHGGKTIGVLGNGIEEVQPVRSRGVAQKMLDTGNVIVSDFPIGTPGSKATYPQRNRIIAGLSEGVLVIEAAEKSGSLITANIALKHAKEVFALPGSIFSTYSTGTNNLLKKSEAHPVTSADDILETLNFKVNATTPVVKVHVPKECSELYELLEYAPVAEHELLKKSQLALNEFQKQISILELEGCVQNIQGSLWVRAI